MRSLLMQVSGVLGAYLPAPPPLIPTIDRRVPFGLKQALVETALNKTFMEALSEGEFDELDGRRVTLRVEDLGIELTLGFWGGRLRLADGGGEVVIRGGLSAFRQLAERREDPDQLFFQRQLMVEGDTELGLAVKNLLDGLDWQLPLLKNALFNRPDGRFNP